MFRGLVASMPGGFGGGGFGRGSALSAVIHGLLLSAVVLGTQKLDLPPEPPRDTTTIIWWVEDQRPPDNRPTELPFGLRPTFAPLILNVPALRLPIPSLGPQELTFTPGAHIALPVLGDAAPDSGSAWGEDEVDEKPERIHTPPLEYPALLRQAGFEGTVTIEVVIDSAGRPEQGSLRVVQSDNRAFEGPAIRAVLRSLFRPGRVRGRPVRVLVQMPVTFTIRR